jgi:hypothetical protein
MEKVPYIGALREAGFNQQVYVIADFVIAVTVN